jgi:hypothetical protein
MILGIMRALVLASVVFWGLATTYAQVLDFDKLGDFEEKDGLFIWPVSNETSPYEGWVNCFQMVVWLDFEVDGAFSGVAFFYSTYPVLSRFGDNMFTGIWRDSQAWEEGPIDFPNGEIIFQFPDGTIQNFNPDSADGTSGLMLIGDSRLVYDLLGTTGDLLVRLDGPKDQEDFKIPHGAFLELAAGFGTTCLG